jgi:hypothetical protein
MATTTGPNEVRLAFNWPKSRVQECLDKSQAHEIVRFLSERHTERFFGPIGCLKKAPGGTSGYGFAIMALCSLLIETLECYRQGLPSSSNNDMGPLKTSSAHAAAPPEYKLDTLTFPNSGEIFKSFFTRSQHQAFFPGVDGEIFFRNIRCGLLHQAQTKDGWRIVRTGKFWDPDPSKQINREEFSERLESCFNAYLGELEAETNWSSDIWKAARRKIWWLVQIS